MAAANDTALAVATMVDASVAMIDTPPPARTPMPRVVSTCASTLSLTLFSIDTPAPEAAMAINPTAPAAPTANILALIVAFSVALTVTMPEPLASALALLR